MNYRKLLLPGASALIAGINRGILLSPDGEIEDISVSEWALRLGTNLQPLVCYLPTVVKRLKCKRFPCFDLLELFAFVRPAEFVLPTPNGLAQALGLPLPANLEKEAETLFLAMTTLLNELVSMPIGNKRKSIIAIAHAMERGGWLWAQFVLAALDEMEKPHSRTLVDALKIWKYLPEWEETPPPIPPGNKPVAPQESKNRLSDILGRGAEKRPQQAAYAAKCAAAFAPINHLGEPHLVLAEAGTGVGKTLGYIAPASIWAETNGGSVWISTFTRNLQRQLDGELDRLHPDPVEKSNRVVIRKGRENYLCLLNFEEATNRIPVSSPNDAIALGLMARWLQATRDGDMVGGDFSAWLVNLFGRQLTVDLTDTRGECIYSACTHYGKCFVEHTVRRAKLADIVVANHALVMVQAAMGEDEGSLPTRYVFDEGHHIFDAADGAFSASLSGRESADLRRWLVGAEAGSNSRSRGLRTRLEDLISDVDVAKEALDEIIQTSHALPGPAWGQRITSGLPKGPTEKFLALVHQQVYARDGGSGTQYALETEPTSPVPGLLNTAKTLEIALKQIIQPIKQLRKSLTKMLNDESDSLNTIQRNRIDAISRSLLQRGLLPIQAWCDMLNCLDNETPDEFIDWFGVERSAGRDVDIGFFRHWVDPTRPFSKTVLEPSHGALITSATLRDRTDDDAQDWFSAERRTGAVHLLSEPIHDTQASPFDYPNKTRVLIVGDVNKMDGAAVAAAYRELFIASGGGGLGLFTSISRLRGVYDRITNQMEGAGLPLYAQHIDAMDTGTLVDIFRAEENSCLLGTDAVRDGVDVPGRSLRLIAFDRVPWPRPTIIHKTRRSHFGGRSYDEMLTRLKLKQAYGRLLRQDGDKGVFVMLDKALPTRLTTAFPEGVEVHRIGLAEAIATTHKFLKDI
jgi:ATP-dependent DNA helicase DinG